MPVPMRITFAGRSEHWTIEIIGPGMHGQKVEYMHDNPVENGLVTLLEHYAHSSAHPESMRKLFGDEG